MPTTFLTPESIPRLQDEVRALARERDAVILAHNYQLPEIQEVADYVGDSLGLSRQAAASSTQAVIAFCGVHFMAETASILCPEKTVLLPDLDAGCSLADSITADAAAGLEGRSPRRRRRHVRQHDGRGQGRDRLLRDLVQRRARRRAHLPRARRRTPRSSSAPTCSSAPTSRRTIGRPMHVWDGECHVHAGIRPARHHDHARRASRRRIAHPPRVRVHDLGARVRRRRRHRPRGRSRCSRPAGCSSGPRATATPARPIVATETGMLHALREAAPERGVHPRQPRGLLQVHEDDHAAEAARRAARRAPRGEGARGDRPPRAHADRAHGLDRLGVTAARIGA